MKRNWCWTYFLFYILLIRGGVSTHPTHPLPTGLFFYTCSLVAVHTTCSDIGPTRLSLRTVNGVILFNEFDYNVYSRNRAYLGPFGTGMSVYTGWQWRNFVPYLCQLIFAAILYVKLWEMSVTVIALKYALLASQWSYGHFLKRTDLMIFE